MMGACAHTSNMVNILDDLDLDLGWIGKFEENSLEIRVVMEENRTGNLFPWILRVLSGLACSGHRA